MVYFIYLNVPIFSANAGSSVSVEKYKSSEFGINFELKHPTSYNKEKIVKIFVPWQNVKYIEKYE